MAGHDGQESIRASSQGNKTRPGQRRMAHWTRDYVRLPGIPDEYIAQDGAPRPVWTRFFDAFAALTPADIERRFATADRHLREAGVTYRAPGEIADRLWPLSHLPLLIDEAEWQQLTAGIVQRAQLLELALGDLYGEGRLVTEGAIPAAAIAGVCAAAQAIGAIGWFTARLRLAQWMALVSLSGGLVLLGLYVQAPRQHLLPQYPDLHFGQTVAEQRWIPNPKEM